MCRFACPVAEATGKESVTPWGIDRVISAMARGKELSAEEMAPVWACTGCRQCGGACVPGLDLPTHVRAARAVAVERNAAPAGIEDAAGREFAAGGPLLAGATAGADLLVYPGCRSEDADALAAVLTAADTEYDVVRQPGCCGARDVDVGQPRAARRRSAALEAQLRNARRVVAADPHCARWLAFDCGDPRVVTLPAFLREIVARLPLRRVAESVAWHDPCWLGRGMAQYDDARAVVEAAAGAPPLEAEHSRDRAWCAGGGMGYAHTDPQGAAEILRRRAGELASTGAMTTVTACPTAAARLRAAGLQGHDLAGYVARRLEGAS